MTKRKASDRVPTGRVTYLGTLNPEQQQEVLDSISGALAETINWMNDPQFGACLPVDPIRKAAYEEAMAKFKGRRSLRATMTDEQIRYVEGYDGPVVLGDPVCERLHAQAKPYPKAASATKSITCTRDVSDPVAIEIRHLPIKRIKPSDYEGIIRNCDPEGNIDVCSDPKFRGNQ